MNERIKELAEQAWVYQMTVYEDNGVRTFGEREQVFSKEKFAELIVRECMLCCERVISDPVPKSADTWLNGGSQCIDEIKQHFGVEE